MGWWMTAKPGDRVIRISDPVERRGNWAGVTIPQVGDVFVIREIGVDPTWFSRSGGVWIDVGLTNADGNPTRHGVVNFRPVQTKSTDTGMAILKRILERPHQRIEEDA